MLYFAYKLNDTCKVSENNWIQPFFPVIHISELELKNKLEVALNSIFIYSDLVNLHFFLNFCEFICCYYFSSLRNEIYLFA